ncbi:MAG: class I adenylate-forming enzyme family protein [Acidimicrobiales bacterium]|jgi:fatty-acyl-CoA synthase
MTAPAKAMTARRDALEARFPEWQEVTLGQRLRLAAEEFADRPFVITDDRTVNYAEVDAWADRLADGLSASGIKPGDRVGIIMANYLEFVPVKFAVARVGAVAIPFNYLYRQDELAYVLGQSQCHALIAMTEFAGLNYQAMLDNIAPGWDTGASDALPHLRQVVLFPTGAGEPRPEVMTLAELEGLGLDNADAADAGSVSPQDVGDILYTSGTTGSPKGVMVTHDAILRTGYSSALTRAFEDGRRVLFSLPCYHMFGLVEGLLAVMYVGGAVIPRTAFSPVDYFAGIETHQANDILAVPTMTVALLEHPDRKTRDLSSLRAILSGAAPAPTWVWERAETELGLTEVTTGYGMTECGGATTLTLPEDALHMHTTTVGREKLAGSAAGLGMNGNHAEYRTADPDTGELLMPGSEGELVSRGPSHMVGFWGKPEETALALRDGWLYSGDLGVVRPDGYLQLTGRTKELYKSGGELVMPIEVEDVATSHPAVSQAFAIGVPDDRWGEVGWLVAIADPAVDVDTEVAAVELMELCREKLARFKVPKRVVFVEAADLPTTPTGKVQKFRLVDQAVAGSLG